MACAYRLPGRAAEAEGALGAALWDAGCEALLEDGDDLVAVFGEAAPAVPPGDAPDHTLSGPPSGPPAVPPGGRWEAVDERDHVAAYFEGLDAVTVGRVVVAPTHRQALLEAGQTVLWLDPGMAFGTGHHETTRLALAALADPGLDLRAKCVLDVGSGSGLLAIAADRLGAAEALGVDIDPITLSIARTNADLNRSRARFEVSDFAAAPPPQGSVDVLVANLFAELHVAFMDAYARALAPGGHAFLTGILAGKEGSVEAALPATLRLVRRERDGEWWLLALERTPDGEP